MKRLLLPLIAILIWPAAASAQWSFDSNFPDNVDSQWSSVHGVAVDPDGKVWVQPFSATDSVEVPQDGGNWNSTRAIHVYNADGSEVSFSPLKIISYTGGAPDDTLGGFWDTAADPDKWEGRSGRGLSTDSDGNIIIAQWNTLFKVDYKTGGGMAKTFIGCSLAESATDANGNVFAACVVPGDPIVMLDTDLNILGNAVGAVAGFSRDFAVSPDGNRIFWAGYTNAAVIEYRRADEFSAYDSIGVVIPGMHSEVLEIDKQGRLWASSGSTNDPPNDYPGFTTNWVNQSWYAFNLSDLVVDTIPPSSESFSWEGGGDGRPRGIAFSPDNMYAYVSQFSQPAPSVQKFVFGATAVERSDSSVPESFALSQNYPNPFNPSTQIRFDLNESGPASLRVYDTLGRQVVELVNETLPAGSYTFTFDASNLTSGTYLYVLQFNGQRQTGKMSLLK